MAVVHGEHDKKTLIPANHLGFSLDILLSKIHV